MTAFGPEAVEGPNNPASHAAVQLEAAASPTQTWSVWVTPSCLGC